MLDKTHKEDLPFRLYNSKEVCRIFDFKLSTFLVKIAPLMRPIKKGGSKHGRSYYTSQEIIRAIDIIFPRITPEQKRELIGRFKGKKKGKS